MVTVERFSSSYSVVNGARAIPYTGETVIMDQRLLVDLRMWRTENQLRDWQRKSLTEQGTGAKQKAISRREERGLVE